MSGQTEWSLGDFAAELKSDVYREELRGSWATALLFRPPAIGLAWLCAKFQLAPIAVTFAALAVALSLPAQALWLPMAMAPFAVFLSGVIYQILDCTDGTLARITGQTSETGANLDFLIDMAQWALLYLAIGILADRFSGGGWGWTAVAASAAWARLMARVVRDRLASGADTEPQKPLQAVEIPAAFLAGISGLIPFFALAGPWLGTAVIALLIYGLLDIAEGFLPMFQRQR